MSCKEKWVIEWIHPKSGRAVKKTLYNEDKALRLIMKKTMEGIEVRHTFYPCRNNGDGNG